MEVKMAETSFIKTAVFGGYDKTETENLFEAMNLQICELQNELRQNKTLLDSFKSDSDEEKGFEALLAAERTKLSQIQAQNETLTAKNLDLNAVSREKDLRIRELEALVSDLRKQLDTANERLGEQDGSAAAMSKVFIEAQKSSDMIREDARAEAERLRQDAVKLAENVISEANESAAKIIRNAEKKAAGISNDETISRRNGVISDMNLLKEEFGKLRELMRDFERSGMECISEGERLLSDASDAVNSCNIGISDTLSDSGEDTEINETPAEPADNDTPNIYQKIKSKVYQTMPVEFMQDQPELTVPEPDSGHAPYEELVSTDTETVSAYEEPVSTDTETVSAEEDQTDDLDMLMAMAEALNDD